MSSIFVLVKETTEGDFDVVHASTTSAVLKVVNLLPTPKENEFYTMWVATSTPYDNSPPTLYPNTNHTFSTLLLADPPTHYRWKSHRYIERSYAQLGNYIEILDPTDSSFVADRITYYSDVGPRITHDSLCLDVSRSFFQNFIEGTVSYPCSITSVPEFILPYIVAQRKDLTDSAYAARQLGNAMQAPTTLVENMPLEDAALLAAMYDAHVLKGEPFSGKMKALYRRLLIDRSTRVECVYVPQPISQAVQVLKVARLVSKMTAIELLDKRQLVRRMTDLFVEKLSETTEALCPLAYRLSGTVEATILHLFADVDDKLKRHQESLRSYCRHAYAHKLEVLRTTPPTEVPVPLMTTALAAYIRSHGPEYVRKGLSFAVDGRPEVTVRLGGEE